MAINVKYVNNADIIAAAFRSQIDSALEECGLTAERYAKAECPVDTGNLRNSITHAKEGTNTEIIGSAVEYAPYVELGTGKYYPGGRQTPWVYTDSKGKTHLTHGNRAQPFLKPAITDHKAEYVNIFVNNLQR